MALKNQIDPERAKAQLAVAIEQNVPDASSVEVTRVEVPQTNGLSTETVLFEAAWGGSSRRLVARVQPVGPAVFPRYDLQLEFHVMDALSRGSDVPVPAMLFSESEPDMLGAPFIVMERIDGRVPSDDPPFTTTGWVLELPAEHQARLYDNALMNLARIHAVDIDTVGLSHLREHPEAGFDGQLHLWEETFTWAAEGDSNPTVEAALDWIREHRPAPDGDLVLNWGDARIGNMLFAEDLTVAAVLDWEMTSVAPRELDLGWWQFLNRYYSEGIGVAPLPGFPDRETLLARYAAVAHHDLDSELVDYYEVFAATRLSILMHRAGNLMVAAGQLPPGAPMRVSNPASHTLARLLGLPIPQGEAQSCAGNR
jgi:aminoglycoside phosphotransferase (APT) family kinase protein